MIGEWELDTKDYHIAIINLSRRVWMLDETYACFTSTHLFIFPKCPPNIFRFSSSLYDLCRMFMLIIMHTCGPYCYLLCYTLWTIIEHPCIEYLISLHKLFCILLLLWRMNHLTLCSSSNCRGFVTSGVIDDFVGVGLRESSISELGIAGTKINTDLPRFGPSMRGKDLRPAYPRLVLIWIWGYKRLAIDVSSRLSLDVWELFFAWGSRSLESTL